MINKYQFRLAKLWGPTLFIVSRFQKDLLQRCCDTIFVTEVSCVLYP